MSNGIFILLQILTDILGATCIYLAIHQLQKKHYFRFGFWIMMAIHNVITLAEILFTF